MATEKQILGNKALTKRLSKLETNEGATPLLFSATVGFFSVAYGGFFFYACLLAGRFDWCKLPKNCPIQHNLK